MKAIYPGLRGKHALLTGAGGGIVRATALALAEQGVDLALVDLNAANLEESAALAEEFGVRTVQIAADVSSAEDVARAVDTAVNSLGQIDILVNGAGIDRGYLIHEMPEDQWDAVLDTNLKSVFLFGREVAKQMIEKKIAGKIVSISSMASKRGETEYGAYGVSKSGINALTRTMALELAPHGIHVNAVCPGYILTGMLRADFEQEAAAEHVSVEDYMSELIRREAPFGRFGTPEEVASFITYLASDASDYITGVALSIAGGTVVF